jgi:hypothetical protein
LIETQQSPQISAKASTKLLALLGFGKLGSTQRREHGPARTVKVFFDQMMAILLHEFHGSFSEPCFETQRSCGFFAKASMNAAF